MIDRIPLNGMFKDIISPTFLKKSIIDLDE